MLILLKKENGLIKELVLAVIIVFFWLIFSWWLLFLSRGVALAPLKADLVPLQEIEALQSRYRWGRLLIRCRRYPFCFVYLAKWRSFTIRVQNASILKNIFSRTFRRKVVGHCISFIPPGPVLLLLREPSGHGSGGGISPRHFPASGSWSVPCAHGGVCYPSLHNG